MNMKGLKMTQLIEAMNEIAGINDKGGKGTVNLKGKIYTNVSTRVEIFRKHLGLEYGLDTEVLFPVRGVMMIAKIRNKDGQVVGSGHAYASDLNKDKSLEKLESVAVGRAMASLGLSGGEYASDGEIESWQDRYAPPKIHMDMGADDVDPESWLASTLNNLDEFVAKPKSTLVKLAEGDRKKRSDPIFMKLNDPQRLEYEEKVKEVENILKSKLKEKETA